MPVWSDVWSGKGLKDCSLGLQWAAMLALSVLFVLLFEALRLPAAFLLGPMCASVLVATANGSVQVPRWFSYVAQGVIGCLIARSFTPSLLGALQHDWPLFLVTSFGVIAAGAALGWLQARRQVLPGTTAVWGSFPGAASVMVLMAQAHGADVRLVAFMQYLRVVLVAFAASMISRFWTGPTGGHAAGRDWFAAVDWLGFGETLALAAFGIVVGLRLRIPAGPMLLTLAIGGALHGSGLMAIELPPWLLAACYAILGWSFGQRFTRPILVHAIRALPSVLAAIFILIAICGCLAFLLVWLAGIDPLTAYLATSPGGADSAAIIAASTKVDVPFVMAQQMARFIVVLAIGPRLARLVARWTGAAEEKG